MSDAAAMLRYLQQEARKNGCVPMDFVPGDHGACAECGVKLTDQTESHLHMDQSARGRLYCRKCCPAGHGEATSQAKQ